VHRAIRSIVRSDLPTTHLRRAEGAKPIPKRLIYPYNENDMVVFGEQCSLTERRADEATRDVVSWLKCEYLRDQVGAVFDGHVSAVTSFGLFVELNDLYVDGLVHITALPHDYYRFEAAQHRLVGERTRRVFGLGDELVVRVVRVDLENRKIDFELESSNAVRRPKKSVVPTSTQKSGTKKADKKKSKSTSSVKSGDRKSASKKSSEKNTAGKTKTVKGDVKKKASAKSSIKDKKLKADVGKKATKEAVAPKSAAPKSAAPKSTVAKSAVAKSAVAKKTPATTTSKAKKSSEVNHGDKAQKTSRAKAPAPIQQPANKTSKRKDLPAKKKTLAEKALGNLNAKTE
jgi:ribonuclease R